MFYVLSMADSLEDFALSDMYLMILRKSAMPQPVRLHAHRIRGVCMYYEQKSTGNISQSLRSPTAAGAAKAPAADMCQSAPC